MRRTCLALHISSAHIQMVAASLKYGTGHQCRIVYGDRFPAGGVCWDAYSRCTPGLLSWDAARAALQQAATHSMQRDTNCTLAEIGRITCAIAAESSASRAPVVYFHMLVPACWSVVDMITEKYSCCQKQRSMAAL